MSARLGLGVAGLEQGAGTPSRRPPRFDVCVVGAGPAGAAAALSARATGAAVGLIGPQPSPAPGPLELIAARARPALAALGLEDLVSSIAQPCVGTVHRWTGTGFDEQSSLIDPDGAGWVVDRSRLDAALWGAAIERGVSVVPERVFDLHDGPCRGPSHIRLADGHIVADKVIVAVGRRRGPLRRTLRREVRHRIVALEARVPAAAIPGLGARLLIDRAPNGWWYALAEAAATHVVYCTDGAELTNGRAGVIRVWEQACRSARDWLPDGATDQRPRARPATIGMSTPAVSQRLTLVGDVALAVDPLSGHGVTLALQAATRYHEPAYRRWLAEMGDAHDRVARDIYRAACGQVDGPFWVRRRRAAPDC